MTLKEEKQIATLRAAGFARQLRQRRRRVKLRQVELAALLGVSEQQISRLERGIVIPNVMLLLLLCGVLGGLPNDYFGYTD